MFRWPKAAVVARREYTVRVRTKAFWISTLAVPAVLLAFTLGPAFFLARGSGQHHVGVVTADEALFARIRALFEERREEEARSSLKVTGSMILPQEDREKQRQDLKQAILAKQYSAVVILPSEPITEAGELKVEYLSTNVTAFQLMATVERAVAQALREKRLAEAGAAPEVVRLAVAGVDLVPVKVSKGGEEKKETVGASFLVGYLLMFIMFFTAVMYGSIVMRGVMEEKTSRIVEVIVANLSPQELMFGKIFGVGAVGLTQYALWLLLSANLLAFSATTGIAGAATILTNPGVMGAFLAFFVLGYFLYGSLFAALGAAFNSEEEAQQVQNVAGWIMALPFLFLVPVMNNPDSPLAVVVSLVPFFAPMLFFLRMVLQTPPLWQTVLCFVLLTATTALVVRLAASVYRVGILSYGARPTIKQIWAWAVGRG
ncbi:MAG: ABC transporter permease [Thermoanaerobaculum sp.]|nr:ABC transporter permease [Thermoanaerobaculum sp.]MDW7968098.1 ABC transporter permease [Thermoanaerobaculum sp.]